MIRAWFTTAYLDARQVGPDQWVLLSPLVFFDVDGKWYTVPAGTLTDFASVPWFARRVFPKSGRWNRAATLHDFQCTQRREDSPAIHARFRRALQACGCNRLTRLSLWLAVRLFGPRFTAATVLATEST